MNNEASKKNMSTRNAQLTLLVIQCLLEVDIRSSRKSHQSLKEKKQLENHKSLSNQFKQKWENNILLEKQKIQNQRKQCVWKMKNIKKKMKPLRNFEMEPKLDFFEKINLIWIFN